SRRANKAAQGTVPLRVPPCTGPLARLSYTESLDPIAFAEAAEQEALSHVRIYLSGMTDAANITLQMLRLWNSRWQMTVGASSKAIKSAQSGKAIIGIKGLPQVRNSAGQIQELMKEVGFGPKTIAQAASVSAIVVSAAHMISAADIART